VWRGFVATPNADTYARYLEEHGVKKFASIPGNRGAEMWRRSDGDRSEFVVVSYWESREAIRNYTGPDWEKAHALPDDEKFILPPGATVTHYDVVFR
jgi:heme-degrading monooxygenase HmoA